MKAATIRVSSDLVTFGVIVNDKRGTIAPGRTRIGMVAGTTCASARVAPISRTRACARAGYYPPTAK